MVAQEKNLDADGFKGTDLKGQKERGVGGGAGVHGAMAVASLMRGRKAKAGGDPARSLGVQNIGLRLKGGDGGRRRGGERAWAGLAGR